MPNEQDAFFFDVNVCVSKCGTPQRKEFMNTKNLYVLVMTITVLLLAAGVAGAVPGWTAVLEPNATAVSAPDVTAAVTNGIGYQGRLTSATGTPLNGTYAMRFVVYDADVAGSALWDSGNLNIAVENGLFNVKLGVDVVDFDGQALWLSIIVDGETLSPRQEILPAPYALSLRPGADIVGDNIAAADAIVASYAPATGTALHAESNGGAGLVSTSQNSYAVWGASDDSFGGYFTSVEGYGIRVETTGADHYDHGAYVSSVEGYAVYAQSSNNQALRGEAGDISGVCIRSRARRCSWGWVRIVGFMGLAVVASVFMARAITARASLAIRAALIGTYGLYTNDNLFSFNINLAGSVMQVMQNSGDVPLAPGDVVVFSGVNRAGADMPCGTGAPRRCGPQHGRGRCGPQPLYGGRARFRLGYGGRVGAFGRADVHARRGGRAGRVFAGCGPGHDTGQRRVGRGQ
jgi:hypothetical protein